MSDKPKSLPETVALMVVDGVEGLSVYLEDYRICGPKPWGGGKTLHTFRARVDDIRKALEKHQ